MGTTRGLLKNRTRTPPYGRHNLHLVFSPNCPVCSFHNSQTTTFSTSTADHRPHLDTRKPVTCCSQYRRFHDYFVTHLPSSSLHPDSQSLNGPHHKLPRAAAFPHRPGPGPSPAAAPHTLDPTRELTVVRIPLRSAKHHFGVAVSRGTRAYNEDKYQAGTIDIPAFARRAPISLNRKSTEHRKENSVGATSVQTASGDPQVFYFGVFDGHGGQECSDFLKDELHSYIERSAQEFELVSSLIATGAGMNSRVNTKDSIGSKSSLYAKPSATNQNYKDYKTINIRPERLQKGLGHNENISVKQAEGKLGNIAGVGSELSDDKKHRAKELEASLVKQWKDTVGGYFRRFKPQHFEIFASGHPRDGISVSPDEDSPRAISIETILMYAFLRADLDFIIAQASKPDATSDVPLNDNEIFGHPSQLAPACRIGGPKRFHGGSTASIAMISTPTATPFWHPESPSTLVAAHVGDTRIILCETATGHALPITTNHHPSSPIEGSRLRRYAATFVTDSFGEERMSGLANTRAFGDMRSKRIGVSAEPELVRLELGPAQFSMLILVSDGVSGTLSDQEIVDIVKEAKTPEQGALDVVAFATEVTREGDNCTCLVVRLGGWERRGEGGMGSLSTKERREWRKKDAGDPRSRRT